MMMPLLTTAFMAQCSNNIKYLNANGWININILVVLAFIMISAVVYALSGIIPTMQRETR